LLIVDGHNTRFSPAAQTALEQANIDLLILPPQSSPILQSLDLTVNGVFKQLLGNYYRTKPNEPLPAQRIRLLSLSALVLESALSILHITKRFARAGIYPFEPQAPFNSTLVESPLLTVTVEPPARKQKKISMVGEILKDGEITLPSLVDVSQTTPEPVIACPE